jgi:hypothetical protein
MNHDVKYDVKNIWTDQMLSMVEMNAYVVCLSIRHVDRR